jgi:LuxR family maltose regulon positive regulatory protein
MADPASVESELPVVDSPTSTDFAPRHYVPRPRLRQQIDRALGTAPVVLMRAPAVSGKTTLLQAWRLGDSGPETAYLGLDALDNDPAHFWSRFADALGLPSEGPVSSATEARWLVDRCRQDLTDHDPLVLVLDRTNLLTDPGVCEILGELLLDLPEALRVILSGRAEPAPALRIGLLRARGQLAELHAADLAFSPEEMQEFFAHIVPLAPEQVQALYERTEGWIGAVALAGLALMRTEDPAAVVDGMTGSNRYIAELLAAEVMAPQPAAIREFLLTTSVLETMDGGLVNAVTGQRSGAGLLDQLEADGMFVESTSDCRSSYRYRPLFREFLRYQLHLHHPEREVAAHLGAAEECERRGDIGSAVAHYVDAGEDEAAVRLVLARGESVAAAGHVDTLARWIALLPSQGLRSDVEHMLAVGRLCVTTGMLDEATAWLDAAWYRLEGSHDDTLLATHALLAAYTEAARGDLEDAQDYAQLTLTLAMDESAVTASLRARANQLLAGIFAVLNRLDEARRHSAATPPDAIGLAPNQAYSAWLAYRLGLLDHAISYAEELLRTSDVPWHMGMPLITRGTVRRERNQLEIAEPDLLAGIEVSRRWSRYSSVVIGSIDLARLRFAQQREGEAFEILTEVRPRANGSYLVQLVAVAEVSFHLRTGDVERARFGREELFEGTLTAPLDVRLALAARRLDDVPQRLATYERSARSLQARITSELLHARFAQAYDDDKGAARHLRHAIELGRRERFVQVFASDLPALEPVLRRLVADYDDPYPFSLLAAVARPSPAGAAALPHPADFEPLSEREQIVLRYLPTALSNKRIAAELHMSVNTLKTHLKSIYRKLRAGSRDESVAHARELHLL